MAKLLLIAFNAADAIQGAGFAQTLGVPFDVLCLVGQADADLGAGTCLSAGLPEVPVADGLTPALAQACAGYSHVAAVSSMRAKDLLARVAGVLDAAMITDVVGCDSPSVFRRPVAAGSAIATVEVLAEPVLLTFRQANFPPAARGGASSASSVALEAAPLSTRVSVTARGGARPDLSTAKVVVTGGRPLKDAATYEQVIGGLADALGGATGATRAAVDSGIAPNELQVGQTGKIVAPDLYIAAGVSGSTQHMAGIKDSKLIVAINKDADAPIFEIADLGLVADLFDAIPQMTARLSG